jgi:hypothetical protein
MWLVTRRAQPPRGGCAQQSPLWRRRQRGGRRGAERCQLSELASLKLQCGIVIGHGKPG